jgi:DNA-binding transcriptional regulator LsrR (DeoR family)
MDNEKVERLIEVSKAYYLENRTQSEIAKSLGVTRSQVSRDLKEARERGIVEININVPGQESAALARTIKARFPHLIDAIIAPSFTTDSEASRTIAGRYAANYLMHSAGPNQKIVLGCGRTLRSMVNALQRTEIPGISVLQAMGNLGHEAHGIDYNEICSTAASAFGAKAFYISSPAILGEKSGPASDLIQANPTIETVLKLAHQADVYVIGLGSLESDLLYTKVGMIQEQELMAIASRAVGDICGRFFDLDGREQPTAFASRIVGIELRDLRQASLSIAVAVGADKVAPILGALRGKWINVLVTDENTARSLAAISARNGH